MRRRKLRGSLAIAWIVLVVVGGVMLNLYLALRPAALEARLRAILADTLTAPFDFSSFALSWNGGAEIRDFRLLDPSRPASGPETAVIGAPYVRVSPDLFALLCGRFEVRQVVIDSPFVRIARSADSRWNVEGLLRTTGTSILSIAEAFRELVTRFPGLLIERGRIIYVVEASTGESVSETIDEVYAHATRDADGDLKLRAEVRVPFARKLQLQATATFSTGKPVVRVGVVATKVDLSAPYHRHLSPALSEEATRLKLKGYASLRGTFQLDAEEGLIPIQVEGDLMRCELAPPHMPFPIRGLKGRFRLTNRTFEAIGLEGTFGSGKVTASAEIDLPESWRLAGGALEKARWSLQSTVEGFTLDRRTRDALPPALQRVLDVYAVQGPLGIEIRVPESHCFPPRPEEVSATVRLEGVSFLYEKFPYLMRDLRGEVLIEKGRLTFKGPIEGHYGPIRATVSGKGAELARDGELDITVKVESVPLDEEFRNALPARARGIWDDFQLVGSGDGVITITRDAAPPAVATGEAAPEPRVPRVTVTANPRQIRMSYKSFQYEIRDIVGSVHLDTGTHRLTFSELKGTHGDQTITGSGVVDLASNPGADSLFRIDLHSEALRVDQDLANALSEEGRRLLADFNFKGHVAAEVSIHSVNGGGTEVTSRLSILEASVRHRKFPYPLDLVGGQIELTGDRAMRFSGIRTAKGAKPGVVFNGTLVTEKTVRNIEFAFDLEDFSFDDRLLDVLPPSLSKFVLGVKLGGTYRGGVDGVFSFDEDDPERYSIVYRGKDITGEEASVDFGLRIHQMKARGSFVGGKSPERAHHLVGEVFVESAWFNRLHLTNGEIDFTLGEEHAAIQSARRGEKLEGREYILPPVMVERLGPGRVADTFQVLVHSADTYGGVADGFLYVDTGAERDFGGDFVGRGFEVAKASEDVFGAGGTNTSGTAKGKFSFKGIGGDILSLKGKGEGVIENARLVELPLFLGILSTMLGENSSRHYFNEVLLAYEIADGKFKARSEGIEIRSPGIKLVGGGTMDFAGNLDIGLDPHIFDLKIPVIEQIFTLLKKGLAQIWIKGDLARPEVKFVTGAAMVRIGIEAGGSTAPLPTDLRKPREAKDLPPGPK